MSFADAVLPAAERTVGMPLATALATEHAEERKFLGALALTAMASFLLQRYFTHFLKGAGFDEMAERHGKAAKALMQATRDGKDLEMVIAESRAVLDESAAELSRRKVDMAAREESIAVVAELLRASGAPPTQAEDVARELAEQVAANLR